MNLDLLSPLLAYDGYLEDLDEQLLEAELCDFEQELDLHKDHARRQRMRRLKVRRQQRKRAAARKARQSQGAIKAPIPRPRRARRKP